nr:MAG TPA: ApaG protein [Caudoviricetes sp.]
MRFYNVTITNVGPITLQYDGGDTCVFDVQFKSTFWQLEDSKNGDFIGQK